MLPADILGQVYEQFLGKVIRLTAGHQAKVEEKPEVKQGRRRLLHAHLHRRLHRRAHRRQAAAKARRPARRRQQLRILDPACGSGSFLLGAYQYLLDWHRDWYVGDDPEKHGRGQGSPRSTRRPRGEWRLTTAERKRILLNNIYGVDIDPQAVEVTKLSLLLKVLEGETERDARHASCSCSTSAPCPTWPTTSSAATR